MEAENIAKETGSPADDHYQLCPCCNNLMGAIRGSPSAICRHCGFKDPCCF